MATLQLEDIENIMFVSHKKKAYAVAFKGTSYAYSYYDFSCLIVELVNHQPAS